MTVEAISPSEPPNESADGDLWLRILTPDTAHVFATVQTLLPTLLALHRVSLAGRWGSLRTVILCDTTGSTGSSFV